MSKQIQKGMVAMGLATMLCSGAAHASLTAFKTYVGNYGVSTSGWGSLTQSGTLTANVPAGATVTAAYLYTSSYQPFSDNPDIGGSFQSNAVSYTPLGLNAAGGNSMEAGRADVTAIVAAAINGGPGGAYNFSITETSDYQDGSALVVVYRLPSLPVSTVGILDGFSTTSGDSTALNLSTPVNLTTPGYFAEMRLGIGFSCCGQASHVTVNGTVITTNAGNNDDSVDANLNNGNLITVGGDNDPFSPLLPTYEGDHERYNLDPQLTNGDTSIRVDTINPSGDDNIFLAVIHVHGRAGVNVPPPAAEAKPVPAGSALGMAMLSMLVGGLGWARRTRSTRH